MVRGEHPFTGRPRVPSRTRRSADRMSPMARILLGMISVVLLMGCAQRDWIDRTLVTENVSGSWYGAMVGLTAGGSEDIRLTFKQEGGKVTGEFRTSGRLASWITSEGALEGTVAGDLFKFNDTRRTITGELTVSGDEMHGQLGQFHADLQRVESSSASTPAKP